MDPRGRDDEDEEQILEMIYEGAHGGEDVGGEDAGGDDAGEDDYSS